MNKADLFPVMKGDLKEFDVVDEILRVRRVVTELFRPYPIHSHYLNTLGSRYFRGSWDKDLPGDVVKSIEEQLEILQVLENFLAYINHIETMGNRKFTYGAWNTDASAEISVGVRVQTIDKTTEG